jgi:uncharacterized Zn finger protein (UPF0148 family)
MTARLCSRCGAPLGHVEPGQAVTCHYCGVEQDIEPAPAPLPPPPVRLEVQGPAYHPPVRDWNPNAEEEKTPSGMPRMAKVILGVAIVGGIGIGIAATVDETMKKADLDRKKAEGQREQELEKARQAAARDEAARPTPSAVVEAGPDPNTLPATVTLTLSGGDAGSFEDPRYVAVDPKGFTYVAEKSGRVQRFDADGKGLSSFRAETTNGPHGSNSTDITIPQGMAADRKGRVWVSIGYDLTAYDGASGKQVARVPHRFPSTCFRNITITPGGMVVRSACTDKDVYALVRMDADGHTLATFPLSPAWQQDADNKVAVDAAGNIYEPHSIDGQVVVDDAHFKVVTRFGSRGDTFGHFSNYAGPGAIALSAKGDLVIANGDDVDVYGVDGQARGRVQRLWQGGVRDVAVGPDGQVWVVAGAGVVRVQLGG